MEDKRNKKRHIKRRSTYIIGLWTILIIIALLCCTNAHLTFAELKELQTTPIQTRFGMQIINPDGPLNLLRGYIYQECGFLYNKRFIAPEIDIKYKLQKEKPKLDQNEYIFERTSADDKVHELSNKREKYSQDYHRTLLQMFPAADNPKIWIDNRSTNSFIAFLRGEVAKDYAHYFLAVLVLLSEGIDVPLECVGEKIILKKKSNEEYFFSLDIKVILNKIQDNKMMIIETEAVAISEFFKNSAKDVLKKPGSMKEFKKGEFLDSPRFLIQAYLFEFINTIQDAIELNKAIYEILSDISIEKESIQKNNLSKYFVSADSIEESSMCLEQFRGIVALTRKKDIFPFSDKIEIPSPIYVSCYDYILDDFDINKSFNNFVETNLYTLFCCLLYDPKTDTYSLEKIKNPSDHLKEFFTRYNRPPNKTIEDILKEWNKVVSGLDTKNIVYLQNRNELDTGLLNFFLVLTHITGLKEQEEELLKFKMELKKLNLSENNTLQNFYSKICNYIEDILKSLCVSDRIQVFCKGIYPKKKKKDLFGLINIEYINVESIHSKKSSSITIKLYDEKYRYKRLRPEDRYQFKKIRRQIAARKKNFMKCLLNNHSIKTISMSFNKKLRIFGDSAIFIKEIIEDDLKTINTLFLLRKFDDTEYKLFVIGCFLCWAKENKIQLSDKSSILRFTSNILASLPLDDKQIREQFNDILVYVGHEKYIYPSIKLPDNELTTIRELSFLEYKTKIDYILYTKSTNVLTAVLKNHSNHSVIQKSILNNIDTITEIFNCLFRDNNIDPARSIFGSHYKNKALSDSCFVWFVLACQNKTDYPDLIKELYDCIDPFNLSIDLAIDTYYSSSYEFKKFSETNADDVIGVIEEIEEELIERGNLSKYRKILELFTGNIFLY